VQTPLTHVLLLHAVPTVQVPEALHVSGWLLPEQLTWPGAHTPLHVPLTHVWLLHAVPATQAPEALHVCGWLEPEQLVWPGAHTPVQAPLTHVWFEQAVVVPPKVPFDWHVAMALPEHVV
jgi:hypothetical protein